VLYDGRGGYEAKRGWLFILMAGPSLLITGASGFTGRYFLEAAKKAGYHCIALAQQEGVHSSSAHVNLTADLLDTEALRFVLKKTNPDYVVHLAAISFIAHDQTSQIYQVNQLGTISLLEAIREYATNIRRVVIASSANIYGNATEAPITEITPPAPVNHYGISKYAMEIAAQLYTDLPIIMTRPFNYTGCGQSSLFLIPKIVGAFRDQQEKIELGNLDVSRDFSDVRDVATAYLRLLEIANPAPVYNICSGKPTSLLSIIDMLNSLAGYEIVVTTNPEFVRSDEILTLYGSPSLLESAIGDYRAFTINESLEWMLRE
jgi:GDP-6-deoxy-D-talose 4-dehydrogenase